MNSHPKLNQTHALNSCPILPFLVAILFMATPALQAKDVGGTLAEDTTWTMADSPVNVTWALSIPVGVVLTVNPGVEVVISQHQAIQVHGTLEASGTALDPIIFRGSTAAPAWWSAIRIHGTGSATLQHCTISDGGYWYGSGVHKEINGNLILRDCLIRNTGGSGLYIGSGSTVLVSENNRFESNTRGIRLGTNTSFRDTSSVFVNNSECQVRYDGGTHTDSLEYELPPDVSLYVAGSMTVAEGATLKLHPGMVIKLSQHNSIFINGLLEAVGTSENPIHFTDYRDDSAGGDTNNNDDGDTPGAGWWGAIRIQGNGSAVFEHCELAYAGYWYASCILKVDTGDLEIRNSIIRNSSRAGLYVHSGYGTFVTENNHFSSNNTGIQLGLNTSFSDTTSTFASNTLAPVWADGGTHTGDVEWRLSPDYSMVLGGQTSVAAGASLTLHPGTVLKVTQHNSLLVDGLLTAEGTPESTIHITDYRDDAVGGDTNNDDSASGPWKGWWGAVRIQGTGSASLEHCNVAYGGYWHGACIQKLGTGTFAMRDCTVRESSASGLFLTKGSASMISENNTFSENVYGVRLGLNTSFRDTTSTFSNNSVSQVAADGGTQSEDARWELSPDYAIHLRGELIVAEGGTLTLAPGLVMKISQHISLIVDGQLNATGTADDPIHVTDYRDDSVGGDTNNDDTATGTWKGWWGAIVIRNEGNALLEHCNIAYGGYWHATNIRKSGTGSLLLRNSTIRQSSAAGLLLYPGSASLVSEYNRYEDNVDGVRLAVGTSFEDTSSVFTNNSRAQVSADGGTYSTDTAWRLSSHNAIYLTGTPTISAGVRMTLHPGLVVKVSQHNAFVVNGELFATGTTGNPIYFTDYRNDTVGGDTNNDGAASAPGAGWWNGLHVNPDGSTSLSNCVIEYGGYFDAAGLYIKGGASVAIHASRIANINGSGLRVNNSSGNVDINRVAITGNLTGAYIQNTQQTIRLTGCRIVGNSNHGVLNANSLEVDARSNWWGADTGPYHPSLNADGTGDRVSDNVLFEPWRSSSSIAEIRSPTRSGTIVAGDALRFLGSALNDPFAGYHWTFGDGRTFAARSPGLVSFPGTGSQQIDFTTVVNNTPDPYPDSRSLTIVPDTGNHPDLRLESMNVPASIGIGIPSTVLYTVSNQGPGDLPSSSWTDRLYLSTDEFLDTGDLLLGTEAVSHELASGSTYNGSIALSLPPIESGAHKLILSINDEWQVLELHRLNNEKAAPVNVLIPGLTAGQPTRANHDTGSVARYFQLNATAGENLLINFAADHAGLEVYLKFGALPSTADYDYRLEGNALAVPSPAPGTWYVLVHSLNMQQGGTFDLAFDMADLAITGSAPASHDPASLLTLDIEGAGFTGSPVIELVAGNGTAYMATTAAINSFSSMTATFGRGQLPPGEYAIRISRNGSTATFSDALTVVSGGKTEFHIDVISPDVMGYHQLATLYVEYGNRGNVPMPAPLVTLTALQNGNPGALFTLDRSLLTRGFWTSAKPKGFSTSIRILAGGDHPGILQPGERMRIPVYYAGWLKPWDFSYPPFEFKASALTTEDTRPIDWTTLKPTLKPEGIEPDAWDAIWLNLTGAIGNQVGDFVGMLSANATYLKQLGNDVRDVNDLLAFEMIKARGLHGPLSELAADVDLVPNQGLLGLVFSRTFPRSITHRFRLGPLGYGWHHNWEMQLTKEADGTVILTDGSGSTRVFQPDSRGRGYFSSRGDTGKLIYSGGIYRLDNGDGHELQFNSAGQLVQVGDSHNNALQFTHAAGRLTRLEHTNGTSINLTYNGSGLIEKAEDSLGNQVFYSYDTGNHLTQVTTAKNRTITYEYITTGDIRKRHALSRIRLPGGVVSAFTYDANGRLASNSNGIASTTFSYEQGNLISTDGTGHTSVMSFDNLGMLCRVVDGDGGVTSFQHDADLNITAVAAPDGSMVQFSYDRNGDLVEVVNQTGSRWSFIPGPHGQPLSRTDPMGRTVTAGYDANGKITRLAYPDGRTNTYQHDAEGRMQTRALAHGITETIGYTDSGLPNSIIYSDGTSRSFQYDGAGRLREATNPEGSTFLDYTASGDLEKITYPNDLYVEYEYDSGGRVSRTIDHNGHATRYGYNTAGMLEWVRDDGGSGLVQYVYDAAGRLAEKRFTTGAKTVFTYNGRAQVTSQTTYDSQGGIRSRYVAAYDVNGLPVTYETPQGNFTFSYNAAGLLASTVFSPPSEPTVETQYLRHPDGSLKSIHQDGVAIPFTTDASGRYTGAGSITATYNEIGRLTSTVMGEETIGYTYDAAGNLTGMQSSTGNYRMRYDALGTPIAVEGPGQTLNYLYDWRGLPHLFGEYDTSGNPVRSYRFGLDMAVVDYQGSTYFPVFDPIEGSPVEALPTGFPGITTSASSPQTYLPYSSPWGLGDPYMPAPHFHGYSMEGFMSVVSNSVKEGGRVSSWVLDNVTPAGIGHKILSNDWFSWGAATAGLLNTLNTVAGNMTDLRIVITDPPDFLRNAVNSVDEVDGLNVLGLLIAGTEVINGVKETWDDNRSIDVIDVLNPFGSVDPGTYKIRHGLATAALTGAGMVLGTAAATAALPVAATVATVAGIAAYISDNTGGLQERFWIWWDGLDVTGETLRGSKMAGSGDPNQKLGVAGYGDENYIAPDTLLTYRIDFENHPDATAPAQVVMIRDQLPPGVDWTSFRILEAGFGDVSVPVPPDAQALEETVRYAYQDHQYTFDIEVVVSVRIEDGEIFAIFTSLDLDSGLPPTVDIGFLPPEPEKTPGTTQPGEGRGMGHITYSVEPVVGLPSGTEIRNIATIQFDFSLEIDTNQVDPLDASKGTDPDKEALVTIDADIPDVSVDPLPQLSPAMIPVSWSGQSTSGMRQFDVYVRENGGSWQPWLIGTSETSALFNGEPNTVYHFYATGTNNVGVSSSYAPAVQAYTTAGMRTVDLLVQRNPAGAVDLSWTAWSGFDYQLQKCHNLQDWEDLGPVHSTVETEESMQYTDSSYGWEGHALYRLVMSPQ